MIMTLYKTVFSSFAMGAISVLIFKTIQFSGIVSENIALLITICVAIVTYIFIAFLIKIDEVKLIVIAIIRRFNVIKK